MDNIIIQIAPYITSFINNSILRSLLELRQEIEKLTKTNKLIGSTCINHAVTHCDNVLNVSDMILKSRDIILSEQEAIILVSVCYYHDIGLFTKLADGSEDYEHIRKNHAIYSHDYINNNDFLNYCSKKTVEVISKICLVHNSVSNLEDLPEHYILDNNHKIRLKLIALIFALADSLDLGNRRIISESYPDEDIKFEEKIFWYRNYCIKSFHIDKDIYLKFDNRLNLKRSEFNETIIQPVINYIKKILNVINDVLIMYNYLPFKIIYKTEQTSEKEITEEDQALNEIIKLAKEISTSSKLRKRRIEEKIKRKGLIRKGKINNELIILKQWSSYTPRMPIWDLKCTEPSKGGGYYLIWNNTSIAIDPGYDFLRNFWDQKIGSDSFEVEDIKNVIISHAHDDHSHDIEPITSLLYKKKKYSDSNLILPVYCSEGVHIKYERLFSNNDSYIKVIDLVPEDNCSSFISEGDKYLFPKGINIEYIKTIHNELPWMKNNTGVSLIFHLASNKGSVKIGYTSDTRYSSRLSEFFKEVDLMLLHFGNFGPDLDFGHIKYDEKHLGITGCYNLISELKNEKPRLFLMGEFGEEEIGGDRVQLCKLLEDLIGLRKVGKALLPMDIGLRISLPDLEVYCQEHTHFVPFINIEPHLPVGQSNISYYCNHR